MSFRSPLSTAPYLWTAAICLVALQFATRFEVAVVVADVLLLLWIAMHPFDNAAGRLLAVCVFMCPIFSLIYFHYTSWVDHSSPWKYDPLLYVIDQRMGFSTFGFARHFYSSALWRAILRVPYESLQIVVLLWYGLHFRRGTHRQVLAAVAATFGIGGGICYWILPACGPVFAFSGFPHQPPVIQSHVLRFSGIPNCMPSLHLATAILFVLFSTGDRGTAIFAWVFLAGTALATLGMGQHYAIDLVFAIPFAFGCAAIARQQWRRAAICLSLTFLPIVLIRWWA